MTARGTALITLGGLTATLTASALFGLVPAGLVALATLWTVATGPSVLGTWRLSPDEADVDPAEVRQYRKDHPGTTVSEAAAAVAHR